MMSLRTYVASRKKDYELLRVLGTPVKVQRTLKMLEYVGSMIVSAVLGALAGTAIVYVLRYFLRHFFPYFKEIKTPHVSAYLMAAGVCLLIFIVCLLINNEVVVETRLLEANKNLFEKSTLLPEYTKWISILGLFFVGISSFAYLGFKDFGEGLFYIIIFLAGMMILWTFAGGSFFRKKEAECAAHPEKMIRWNAFYHRYYSKGLKRFLLFVLSFFLLYYYALQVAGSLPIQLGDEEFPYEFVRDTYGNGNCGQSIGISESVYQKLTGRRPGLNGKEIYIVFQQLCSDKAHPLDYATIGEISLHFGSAYTHLGYLEPEELFRSYEIKGSERKVLFGYLGKGYNENIVVFSDDYFQKITECEIQEDLNEKWGSHPETDYRINFDEPEKAENYPDSLVLIKANKSSISEIEALLQDYEQSLPFERKVQYLYDATVNMYYNSSTVTRECTAERTLKLVTCSLQFVFLLLVMLYLVYLNMNEDYEMKKRQFEFLRCLGLPKKQAADAVLFESGFTAYMPLAVGSVVSLAFAAGIGNLRNYTGAEWKNYLIVMAAMWCVTYLSYFFIYKFMRKRMERQLIS